MRLRSAFIGGVALAALSGCTMPLDELRGIEPQGSAFALALAEGYRALAEAEAGQYDWIDSSIFAEKGLAAAKGEAVAPEKPADWDIDGGPGHELLSLQRARLVSALDAGGRERAPQIAARAQTGYDCWLEQLEEGWQHEDIAACRKQFEDALAALSGRLPAAAAAAEIGAAAPAARPAEEPAPVAAADAEGFRIYFDYASVALGPAAREIIAEAAAAAGDRKLVVVGHADSAGPAQANLVMSARRAAAVKRALVELGVPPARIDTVALGETDPAVATPDETREAHNRRVTIRLR